MVVAAIMQPHLAIIFYVIAVFIFASEEVERIPQPYIPPIPEEAKAESPNISSHDPESLAKTYSDIETRIAALEDKVTSKEFLLRKKFEEL